MRWHQWGLISMAIVQGGALGFCKEINDILEHLSVLMMGHHWSFGPQPSRQPVFQFTITILPAHGISSQDKGA